MQSKHYNFLAILVVTYILQKEFDLEIKQTDIFQKWLVRLKDNQARTRILIRIRRMQEGNSGDVRSVGSGISEMRIPYGPGYRIYFVERGAEIVILLCGGDKSSQSRDIEKAKNLASEF